MKTLDEVNNKLRELEGISMTATSSDTPSKTGGTYIAMSDTPASKVEEHANTYNQEEAY